MHIMNIGLAIGSTSAFLTVSQVVQAVERAGLRIAQINVHESDTEPTIVLRTPDWDSHAVATLSTVLGQDCIAVWHPLREGQPGELIGPKADEWGPFNPEFFLLPEGGRLADFLPLIADEPVAA